MEPLPIFGISGVSGSGKTRLMERLLSEFFTQNRRVAAFKHAPHGLDDPDRLPDTAQFARAGAAMVLAASPTETRIRMTRPEPDPFELARMARSQNPALEFALVEGWKQIVFPRIEVWRKSVSPRPVLCHRDGVLARVSEDASPDGLPVLHPDATKEIAAFILKALER